MSSINYKPEQQAVIDCQNKNQLVSASAGSGKTTIMIQKIINLITKEKINIKEILVLTYTKASAEEMKQKLVSAIYEQVKHDKTLLKQIDDIETSDISTIHSFFQKVIKKYFMVLNINPNFELMDEVSGATLQNLAMQQTINAYNKQNPNSFSNLLSVYGSGRNTKKIEELIYKIYRFLLAVPNKAHWVNKTAACLYQGIDDNVAIKILNDEIFFAAHHFVKVFKQLQKTSVDFQAEKYIEITNKILGDLECIKPQQEHFFRNVEKFKTFTKTVLTRNDDMPDLYNKLKSAKESLSDFIKVVKKWEFTDKLQLEKNMKFAQQIVIALCELVTIFEENYLKLKNQNNVLDYDDLEKYMLLLIENPEVRTTLKNHYARIFVDEYQDANRVQEKIIKAISRRNNRFMVGDLKQSIYGFRQAEPDIFMETLDEFLNSNESEVGFLNYNFRSHKLILNFVNLVFSKIMTPKTSKIDYAKTSIFKWDEVYKDIKNQNLPTVEINIIKKPEKEKLPQPTKMYSVLDKEEEKEEYSNAQLEAFFVANKIASILGKQIYVAKEKRTREIEYKDITILLRGRGEYLDEFCNVITSLSIPLYANTNTSLFDDGDVLLLHNVIALSVNPQNDIALASVMHSPFGGFSFDELAKIRLFGSNKTSFYDCVIAYSIQDEILHKITAFQKFLESFGFKAANLGLYKAFTEIIKDAQFENHVLAKPDGIQKLEKINKYVNSFLTNGYNFLPQKFLEFVDVNRESIKAPDYTGGANCVSITTMHSSKGLEYPVVIIANAGQDLTKGKNEPELLLNQNLGLGVRDFDLTNRTVKPSLVLTAIKKANNFNEFAEKLRLLYVALTRPQNHLIIVGTTSKSFELASGDYQILKQKSFLNLIVNTLPSEEIEKINNDESLINSNYAVNVILSKTEKQFMTEEVKVPENIDENAKTMLQTYLDFSVPQGKQKEDASVTQIRKFCQKEQFTKTQAENFEENLAAVGNAYHSVMEEINFDYVKTLEDVKGFLKTCKIENAGLVDAEKVFGAIQKIKQFNAKVYLKEHPFVLEENLLLLSKDMPNKEVCLRGVIDLLALGNENIIVDYKFTTEPNPEKIIEKYAIQLKLYEKACNLAGIAVHKKYILLLNTSELVEII